MKISPEKLGNLVQIQGGGTPDRSEISYWGGNIPWATVKDFIDIELNSTKENITQAGLDSCASSLIPAGHVLTPTRMGLGRAAINTVNMAINQDIKALKCNKRLHPKYLLRYLIHLAPHIESLGTGATVKGITLSQLKSLEMPLPMPPVSEQRRIATILDKADALRRKRRDAIRLIDELLRSTFLDLFGDPITNPMNWPMGPIGDLAAAVQYGTSAKAGSTGAFKILRMGNITYEGGWDFSDMKFIDLAPDEVQRYSVNKGEVLFNRTNSRELVGKTAVFREEEPMIYAGYLVKLTVNDRADGEYVGAVMNTRSMKAYLRAKCKNIIGMANINASEFKAIPVPIPPIKLQKKFASIVHKTLRARERLTSALQEADKLFSAIESRAFKGAL